MKGKKNSKLFKSIDFNKYNTDIEEKSSTSYISEATKISDLAVKSLKSFYYIKTHWNFSEASKTQSSLNECYSQLKKLLVHHVNTKNFTFVIPIYKLLGEVAFVAQDYSRSIKYYSQAVKFINKGAEVG